MKHLLVIRHAKSDWSDGSLSDFDRPLNKRGKHDAPLMARFLIAKGLHPDVWISSPASRALGTAKLFAAEFNLSDGQIIKEETLYEAFTHQLMSAIHSLPASAKTACIFSHNPTVTSVISQFADDYIPNVPTCGIGYITVPSEHWGDIQPGKATLKELWTPKSCLDAYN